MSPRRWSPRLWACLLAGLAGAAHAAPPAASPFERQRAALEAELAARAGAPEAGATLGALLALEDGLPPGALEPTLRRVAESKRSHPLVAAVAAYHLALEEGRRGDAAAAGRRWDALGSSLLDDVWIVGPFEAQGRGGLGRVFPPEDPGADPARGGTYAGKEREVSWRRVRGGVRRGALVLDGLLRPDADAVAYVLATVESPRRRRAVLRVGAAGPVKVWCNGALALERNVVHPPAPDQYAAAVELRPGRNRLLFKTVITAGPWRLFARLTDGERTPRDLVGLLAARARAADGRGPRAAAAWLDHARAARLFRTNDVDAKEGERAARRAAELGAGPEAELLRAELAADENERRAALEAAARARDPGFRARALAELGDLARVRRREAEAMRLWNEALAADETCFPAVLSLAVEEQVAGLPAAALARLDRLPPAVRAVPRVVRARARLLDELGRRREAEDVRRALHGALRTDPDVVQELVSAARHRGDPDEAARLLGEITAQHPELSFLPIERARLLEGAGRAGEARAALEEAIRLLPEEARLHEELGKLHAREGRLAEAAAAVRQALLLRPQNPTLRRYLERLAEEASPAPGRAAAAADLALSHAEDVRGDVVAVLEEEARAEGRRAGARATGAAAASADSATILLDKRVVRVHRNGLAESYWHRVVHVRTERAARENLEFHVRYTPGQHEVEIRQARIWRRDPAGTIEVSEATGRDDRDLSEPWYGLYYDTRAEVVSFEGLKPGDVLEVAYTVADVSSENALADYFGDLDLIAENAPKRRWEYTLIGPAERRFHFNEPRLPGLKAISETKDGVVVHRFMAREVPKIHPEPAMPGWAEVAPYLHVSTYSDWSEVGRWYTNLVEDQMAADQELRRTAREITAGAASVEDRVRAVHRFVVENTRYVGLEFGIHGYKPYKVTQVLARRFGDCKDKASLFIALLREVGVESELVLLRTRRAGRVAPAPASLAVFDHAIAYVPSLDLYVDGTAEFSGTRELPNQDQGVMALRLTKGGARLIETPVLPSAANRAARRWSAALDPSGAARVEEVVTITGQAASEWREHYQTPGERQERYGKVWSGRSPGAVLEEVVFEGVEDRNEPVRVRAVVAVPRLAPPAAEGRLLAPLTTRETDFIRSYARLSQRRHELVIAYPWQHEEDLVYRLPEGWSIERLPSRAAAETRFGRFELDASAEEGGRAVRVRSLVDVRTHRIAPGDYAAFRAFLRTIDAALAQRVAIKRDE